MIIEAARLQDGVEAKVHQIFRDSLEIEVDAHTDVIAGGLLNSMAFVQLLVALEEEFGLEVNLADMELENFTSVSNISRLVSTMGYGVAP